MVYPVIEVPEDAPTQLEQLGTKGKFWFHGEDGRRVLFKEGRLGTGENWAEKVSCEVARLLGLPHAHYDLACHRGRQGTVTPSFVPSDGRLIHGNELLAKSAEDYDADERFHARQHTVRSVVGVLRHVRVPADWDPANRLRLLAEAAKLR